MNSLIKVMPNIQKYNDYIFDIKTGVNPIMLSGLTDMGKIHMSYSTKFYTEKPICIITYNELQAKKIINDMKFFEDNISFFPKREIANFDYAVESRDILFERINVLNKIKNKKTNIVVTSIEAVMQKMVPQKILYNNTIVIRNGININLNELKEKLILLGYERYDLVEGSCQFSVRGGIIDIALSSQEGIRVELWGDEVDSIRKFNILTQRTTDMLDEIEILPANEFVLESSLENVCEKISLENVTDIIKNKIFSDIEEIKNGNYINKIDKYFDCFYSPSSNFIDYLGSDYIIFIDEKVKIKDRAFAIIKDYKNLKTDMLEKNKIIPESFINEDDYLKLKKCLEDRQVVYLEQQDIGFVDKESMHAKRNGYSFSYREVNFFRSSLDLLFQKLQKSISTQKQTIILRRR